MKMFEGLNVSSKIGICGLPIRLDTYMTCTFGCRYCFSNNRIIAGGGDEIAIANVSSIRRRLEKIKAEKYDSTNLLDTLINNGITWHCGGMSDPFQPINKKLLITNKVIDICNEYGIHILFSTKSDDLHNANIRPDLHSFQFSVSNVENRKDIEPNVPDIESRITLFKHLKQNNFKVGIRIQPFIPNISSLDIVKRFGGGRPFYD